jgi:hypothetical protein
MKPLTIYNLTYADLKENKKKLMILAHCQVSPNALTFKEITIYPGSSVPQEDTLKSYHLVLVNVTC